MDLLADICCLMKTARPMPFLKIRETRVDTFLLYWWRVLILQRGLLYLLEINLAIKRGTWNESTAGVYW